jgi:hypothetical protein
MTVHDSGKANFVVRRCSRWLGSAIGGLALVVTVAASPSTYNAASTYNIYGYLAGKYYLLGTTRRFSYSTHGIILNRSLNGFTRFAVQEVNAAGDFQPLPGQS